MRSFLLRLAATFWPGRSERRLHDEFNEHLEALATQEKERGLPPNEARLAAHREFGSIEVAKERYRDQARFRVVENLGRDFGFALRQFRKSPGFTAAAVLSLAFGIGANAALFSFVNAVLLKHLPVPDVTRLAILENGNNALPLSYDQLEALNRNATELDGLLGTYPLDVSVIFGDRPEWVSAELVTSSYFAVIQMKPERGRLLRQSDFDGVEGNPVCVISHRFWKSRLGGAENVIGRTILINTRQYQILGVDDRDFNGLDLQRPTDLQIPAKRLRDFLPAFVGNPKFDWKRRLSLFSAVARLKPGRRKASAAAQLTRLNRAYLKYAKLNKDTANVQLTNGTAGLQSSSQLAKPASILLGVSLVVLVIACANLATLFLSRTSARSFEFALRLAIGSSRGRILAQLLVESALLAALGTAASIAVGYAIQQILLSFLNRTAPSIHQLHVALDGTVFLFVCLTSVVCILLFGVAPAVQAARTAALGSSAGNTGTGTILRKAFLIAQIALSFVVVLSAGLLAGTLRNLKAVDLSYQPDEIASLDLRPAAGGYAGPQADQFYRRIVDRVRTLPGVKAASSAFGINFEGGLKMKVQSLLQPSREFEVNVYGVNDGYFNTFGAHILAGRDFNASDTADKPQVYIISEHLAKTYFHDEDPVGRHLRREGADLLVVGVASDLHDGGLRETSLDTVYQDAGQLLASSLTVFVRCAGPCAPLLPTLRAAIRSTDANTPILSLRTLRTEMDGAFSSEQVLGFLSLLFAALAILLVALGMYGLLSYTSTSRTREMAIRIAVGALAKDIAGLFIRETAMLAALGTLLGVPCALAAVTLLKSQLFGVEPHDRTTLVGCVVCVLTTVILASIGPIRRACRIAPQVALRVD